MLIRIEVVAEDGEPASSLDIVTTMDGVPALYQGLTPGMPYTIYCKTAEEWMPGGGILLAPAGAIQAAPEIAAAANEQRA